MPMVKEIKPVWTKEELEKLIEMPKHEKEMRMKHRLEDAQMTAEKAREFLGMVSAEFARMSHKLDYCWTPNGYLYSRASVEAYKATMQK